MRFGNVDNLSALASLTNRRLLTKHRVRISAAAADVC